MPLVVSSHALRQAHVSSDRFERRRIALPFRSNSTQVIDPKHRVRTNNPHDCIPNPTAQATYEIKLFFQVP